MSSINNQLDAVFSFFLYFCYTLYMFRVPFAPIIRSILKTSNIKKHMSVQSVVISLAKNLVWYSTQNLTQENKRVATALGSGNISL
jgi:hypothetical protein